MSSSSNTNDHQHPNTRKEGDYHDSSREILSLDSRNNVTNVNKSIDLSNHEPPNKKVKRVPLHVEAVLKPCCVTPMEILQSEIQKFITSTGQSSFTYKEGILDLTKAPDIIRMNCIEISIHDIDFELIHNNNNDSNNHNTANTSRRLVGSHEFSTINSTPKTIASWNISNILVHTFILSEEDAEPEELDMDNSNENEEDAVVCETLPLPHSTLHTSWENLILPQHIKANLLGYAESSLLFSNYSVSSHIISWNRILLLHGPPGTGKTTLCRALAHKLAIRTQKTFSNGGFLLEIKSHSLFSKWFSESGKLVAKLFTRIREMVEDDPQSLFCILIDEVESLASSRVGNSSSESVEPSDSIRAVNSLLTSIDKLKAYRNVIVLTTTNITSSVDRAFMDRLDMKQFIGLPCLEARYEILRSCLEELIRVGIVYNPQKLTDSQVSHGLMNIHQLAVIINGDEKKEDDVSLEMKLLECAQDADGLSGRTLRKLPFQSHAFFVRSTNPTTLISFLDALKDGILQEQSSRKELSIK